MKTTVKIFLTAAVISIFSIAADAQIWVNGVDVFTTKMTKEEVIAKFGEPTEYEVNDSGDNGVNVWYHYNNDIIRFKDNHLIGFTIKTNKFTVRVNGLDLNISVGDKFSVLEPLKPIYMDWYEKNWYCLYFYDEMVSFEVINGIIQCVDFSGSI